MEQYTNQVIALYQTGLSASAIATQERLKLHTVYRVLRKENIQRRSAAEQNRLRFERSPKTYNPLERLTPQQRLLQVAALMLYWGEGAKTGNTVDLTNSSLPALQLFLKYLQEICQIDQNKLRFYLYCFSGDDPNKLIGYWSKALKVPKSHFTKPYIRASRGYVSSRAVPHGVLHIRYSDKRLLKEILDNCEAILTHLAP